MKTIIAILFSTAAAGAVAAPPSPSCPSGDSWVPWQLKASWYAETPVFAGDQNKNVATVCNCTEDSTTADAGVWIVAIQPIPPDQKAKQGRVLSHRPGWYKQRPLDDTKPPPDDMQPGPGNDIYYLQGGACSVVGPGSVILRTADHRGPKWGVWRLEGKP